MFKNNSDLIKEESAVPVIIYCLDQHTHILLQLLILLLILHEKQTNWLLFSCINPSINQQDLIIGLFSSLRAAMNNQPSCRSKAQ